jgi:hypothetical protein
MSKPPPITLLQVSQSSARCAQHWSPSKVTQISIKAMPWKLQVHHNALHNLRQRPWSGAHLKTRRQSSMEMCHNLTVLSMDAVSRNCDLDQARSSTSAEWPAADTHSVET